MNYAEMWKNPHRIKERLKAQAYKLSQSSKLGNSNLQVHFDENLNIIWLILLHQLKNQKSEGKKLEMKLFSKIPLENKGLFVLVWDCPDQIAVSVKKDFAQNITTISACKFKIQLNLLH